MKISFLVHHMYGIGGTVRSVANLAGGLAERHTVEIASVYRSQHQPEIALDPRVRLVPLVDARRRGWRYLAPGARSPSRAPRDPGPAASGYPPSRLTDRRVARYLRRTDADVVIATRPLLISYLATYGAGRGYLRIGQEHRTLHSHPEELLPDYLGAIRRLDAFVPVSEADAGHWREALRDSRPQVVAIPNAVPQPEVAPASGDSHVIVAAGRFIPVKRYDRLIRAFARIADRRPDWQLRLYGRGRKADRYRALIEQLGMTDRVILMGAVSPIAPEWAKGSIAAVSSDEESFGMTIVEAMSAGLPVVSMDCPHGPREIIQHGENGLLVPLDDGVRGLARALLRLIDQDVERHRMGKAARRTATRYAPHRIAARYEELCAALTTGLPVSAPLPDAVRPGPVTAVAARPAGGQPGASHR